VLSLLERKSIMTKQSKQNPSQPKAPTIEVSGKAFRQQVAKSGVMKVPVSANNRVQEAAWAEFQVLIAQLRDAVGTYGTLGNSMPTERSSEISKWQSGVEYTVSTIIEVEFIPANYGEILQALVKCGLPAHSPRFTYDDLAKITPELLAKASEDAKDNAAGVAAGIQGRLGRLVSIQVGQPARKSVFRPFREFDWGLSYSLHSKVQALNFSDGLDEEKIETYDTEVVVTVKYEVIENSNLTEVL
jgi:uncharacterized protein YggE